MNIYTHQCGARLESACQAFVHLLVCPQANEPVGPAKTPYSSPTKAQARRERMRLVAGDLR